MSLVGGVFRTASVNPHKNLDDSLRLLGFRVRLAERYRLQKEFEPGGRLHRLIQFDETTKPIIFAERYGEFDRRRPLKWEIPLIEAGHVAESTVPEPAMVIDDQQHKHIYNHRRLLLNLQLPENDKTLLMHNVDYLIADWQAGRPLDEDILVSLMATLYHFGQAHRSLGREEALSNALQSSLRSEKERAAAEKLLLLQHQRGTSPRRADNGVGATKSADQVEITH